MELSGQAGTRYIEVQRNPLYEETGADLVVKSGSPTGSQLSIDKNGGNLYLSSGDAVGAGSSNVYIQTANAGSSGTAENAAITQLAVLGNGNVGIGAPSPTKKLEVSGDALLADRSSLGSEKVTNGGFSCKSQPLP